MSALTDGEARQAVRALAAVTGLRERGATWAQVARMTGAPDAAAAKRDCKRLTARLRPLVKQRANTLLLARDAQGETVPDAGNVGCAWELQGDPQ